MTADSGGAGTEGCMHACDCQEYQSGYLALKMLHANTFTDLIAVIVVQLHFYQFTLSAVIQRLTGFLLTSSDHLCCVVTQRAVPELLFKCLTSQCNINTLWAIWLKTKAGRGFTIIVVLFYHPSHGKKYHSLIPQLATCLDRGFISASISGGLVSIIQKIVINCQTECLNVFKIRQKSCNVE